MTKENQEKQNGRTEGGSGKNANRRNNDRRKNNTSFKRVNLERKRPQLSRGETAAAKEAPSGGRKPRRGLGRRARIRTRSSRSSRSAVLTPSART